MINIVYGLKGSGKTKTIIEKANKRADLSKGSVLYITDQSSHSLDVNRKIRFIDITKYDVGNEETLLAFIKGLLAGNYDITDIFADGPGKFVKKDVESMDAFYKQIENLSEIFSTDFTFTVSTEEVPDYMKKYL